MKLLLLHSPLTGPSVWQNLAPLLQARGFDVLVPDYRDALSGAPPYYPAIIQSIAAQAHEADVPVAHSGAGALVSALVSAISPRAVVFMDALLPHPGKRWFDTVPEAMRVHLRGLESGEHLPSWDRWWSTGTLEAMLPDIALRKVFTAELPSLPLGYFEECAPDISLPEKFPCAYLQLSSGYDTEVREAQSLGWPTQRLTRNHLAMLTHPDEAADELCSLMQAIA
ncbi:MAG: alpha/beta hydrolase [Proteobacteria bacterium]|nr:alpha/beta hydrolase [Pseudomonadota bacterium]